MKALLAEMKVILKMLKGPKAQVFTLITVIMLVVEYFGWQRPFFQVIAPALSLTGTKHQLTLYAQIHTTLSFLLLFCIIPLIYYKTLARELPIEGLTIPRSNTAKPYFIFGAIMVTVLAIVCNSPNFYRFYPLFRPNDISEWLLFEAIYLPQFIAVEFFFRGPLLFSLNRIYGTSAIFMMTLPYALVHIHKPFPEAMGSIGAGIILGHYSLKSGSIWFGVLLHMLIAISADFFGLYYSGTMGRW